MDFNSSFLNEASIEPVTRKDLEDLKTEMNVMKTAILQEHQVTQKLLKRVLEEVKSNRPTKSISRKPILPKTLFNNDEFMEFEKKIESSESKYKDLLVELKEMAASNGAAFIKMAWKKIIPDEVVCKFSWKGTSAKLPTRALSVTAALKESYNQKFSTSNDKEFIKTNIAFFQHASNRLKKNGSMRWLELINKM